MIDIAPFGAWRSPISADSLVSKTVRLSEPRLDGEYLYWIESRPLEQGRNAIVRIALDTGAPNPSQQSQEVLPAPLNARSRAHEYGGGSYCVDAGIVYFVLFDDQRLYRLDTNQSSAARRATPEPLTPEGDWRHADLCLDKTRNRLLCVREDHSTGGEPRNSIVAVSLDADARDAIQTLASGEDFYSNPRVSPDATRLSWLSWNHPDMPWDNTRCQVADFDAQGRLSPPRRIAGGDGESVFQPQWSPAGDLFFVSDRNNWWNIYRCGDTGDGGGAITPVTDLEAEFATPQWVFGMSTYGFVGADKLIACYTREGRWQLALIELDVPVLTPIATELSHIAGLVCHPDKGRAAAAFLGGSEDQAEALWYCDLPGISAQLSNSASNPDSHPNSHPLTGHPRGAPPALVKSTGEGLDPTLISRPRAISFPSAGNHTAHGFFYPPANPRFAGPEGQKPPLIVLCHGGPTGATESSLNLKIQYWTSRGFAILDVNYRGSTGYGRRYREQLRYNWGLADVDDVCAGAEYLVARGLVDGDKLAIKGGSAGGYTVLAALTFRNTFKAGASHYGIGDLETLARDTHKFESRYLDRLVGPYPEARERYRQRSPINHCDRLNCPVIFFQGLEDKVVPPNQAESMVNALRDKGIPVAYVPFAGEGHGFRRADAIKRALEGELYFYGRIFGFAPAEPIEPLAIHHLGSR